MIKAVIFDLDDTLYNEVDYCQSGFWAVAKYLSQTTPEKSPERFFNVLWEQFGKSNKKVFNNSLDELSIFYNEDFIKNLVNIYRDHKPDIVLPQESRQVLELLKTKYQLGLITDGFLPAQKLKVAALGIENYFDSIIYTEELGREHWKPDVLSFETILDNLDVSAQNAVYVGDNAEKDFIGANKVKLHTIQLVRIEKIHKNSSENSFAKAEYKIDELGQLPDILGKL